MAFTESGTLGIHTAVLVAGAVYLIAVLLFTDVVFSAIRAATKAACAVVAKIGSGYGTLFVDLHTLQTLPKNRKASARSKIIGVLHKWWVKVRDAFGGMIGRQPPRIRELMTNSEEE